MRRPWPLVTSPLRLLTVIGARQPVARMIEARSLICSGGCWLGFLGLGRRSFSGTMASCAQNTGTLPAYAFGVAVVLYSSISGPVCGCGLSFAMWFLLSECCGRTSYFSGPPSSCGLASVLTVLLHQSPGLNELFSHLRMLDSL